MATSSSETGFENSYKVKLKSTSGDTVIFDATPDLIETRNVNYGAIEPIHAPGQINVYKNTSSRSFNISNAKLLSRTQKEAQKTLDKLWLLRSWCTPRFGTAGSGILGEPPEVLLLSAYSRGAQSGKSQHIHQVPIVIQQLSIPYPSDVDYIVTEKSVPMPTIMTIDLTLVETHSPGEYERFSLDAFKTGNLRNF